nr:unnamed protein product [Callosobruchus analis]
MVKISDHPGCILKLENILGGTAFLKGKEIVFMPCTLIQIATANVKKNRKTMSSRKLFQYTENAMQNALDAIRLQSMPISTACKKFNVPRTSVRNRLDGKTKDGC